jgi:hypothetical protein
MILRMTDLSRFHGGFAVDSRGKGKSMNSMNANHEEHGELTQNTHANKHRWLAPAAISPIQTYEIGIGQENLDEILIAS